MPDSKDTMNQEIAAEFAVLLAEALECDPLPAKPVFDAIRKVFGDEPVTPAMLLQAIKLRQYEQLAESLDEKLEVDGIDDDVVFGAMMQAVKIVTGRYEADSGKEEKKRPYEEAVRDPDFAWVEKHLGAAIPKTLKDAYTSGEVLELDHITVDEEDPELYFSITYFHLQDEGGYRQVWPGTEGMLILADDGAGNVYFAIPKEKFKHVYFYDHETGERWRVGVSVPGFIKKLREHKPAADGPPSGQADRLLGKWKAVSSKTNKLKKILEFIPLYLTFTPDGKCLSEYRDDDEEDEIIDWELIDDPKSGKSWLIRDGEKSLIEILGGTSFSETGTDGGFEITYEKV